MNDRTPAFVLSARQGQAPAPVLVGVQTQGRLDAVLFELTLRQTYRNTSAQCLEVVYTFPLPPAAVLLGFASELNGQRQQGVIEPRHNAERQYETALAEGHAPVMLEVNQHGVHTANIGNLQPGDEVELECRFALLLAPEQGRLRVSIPTTIAPRYGQAAQAGLQAQQVPQVDLAAEYPLAVSLVIGEALAGAEVDCPTHRCTRQTGEDGLLRLTLAEGAWLDRDLVVVVTPREQQPSLCVRASDTVDAEAPVVMMASLVPAAPASRAPLAIKLLVDCSGSMAGDSLFSAQAALRGVVASLDEDDQVSLSRFGSSVDHVFGLSPARPQALRHLQPLIDGLQANLGGTEMGGALTSVFDLPGPTSPAGADVLLITDGAIWHANAVVQAARDSGHRVFAIGVGSAPGEGLLRSLAEATGGACELATPGESLEAAARRMLQRMRQPRHSGVRVDWGDTPVWTWGPVQAAFSGDAVIALAGFRNPLPRTPVRLLADGPQGQAVELARSEADAPAPGDALARIAAAHRCRAAPVQPGHRGGTRPGRALPADVPPHPLHPGAPTCR